MPTKRTRTRRTGRVPANVLAILGIGCGINTMSREELRALWDEHGEAVRNYFAKRYPEGEREPFVEMVGRREGWITDAD